MVNGDNDPSQLAAFTLNEYGVLCDAVLGDPRLTTLKKRYRSGGEISL